MILRFTKKHPISCWVLLLFLFSFLSLNFVYGQYRNPFPKNSFEKAEITDFYSIVQNDTITFKELKFTGVHSMHYIQKGIYDRFGKWDQAIYSYDTLLVWNKVKLFKDDNKLFKVVGKGGRKWLHPYTSVMVFDQNDNDLLVKNSEYLKRLKDYFSTLIKTNNNSQVDFYIEFWDMFVKLENRNSQWAKFQKNKYISMKKKIERRRRRKNKN